MHWHSETESSRASPALLNQTYSAGARLARDRPSCGPCIVSPVLKPSGAKKNFKSPRVSGTKSAALSGCRIMALLQLPKLITRVRFPSPAPLFSRLSAAPVRIVNELRATLGDVQSHHQAADQILSPPSTPLHVAPPKNDMAGLKCIKIKRWNIPCAEQVWTFRRHKIIAKQIIRTPIFTRENASQI